MDVHFNRAITADAGKTMQPEASRVKQGGRTAAAFDGRLKKACADFEGLFLNMMIQTMRKSIPEGGVLGKSHQSELFDSMFFQEISTKLARERGLGIGDALYRQVRRRMIETGGK